jgi:hypothetical protein
MAPAYAACPTCKASTSAGSSGGEAGLQGLDESPFQRRRPAVGGQSEFHSGPGQRRGQVDGVEGLPRLVVVRADGVGDTPPRDCGYQRSQ